MRRLSNSILSTTGLRTTDPTLAGEDSEMRSVFLTRRLDGLSTMLVGLRVVVACVALEPVLPQGADPSRRPELAIRAAQLVRPRHRRGLARTFRGVVAEAVRPATPIRSTAVVICRHQIRAQAGDLLALADRLDDPRLASAAGVAIAQ